jgi:hypothetical protein
MARMYWWIRIYTVHTSNKTYINEIKGKMFAPELNP